MEQKDSRVSKKKRTILLSSRYRHAWRSFINCMSRNWTNEILLNREMKSWQLSAERFQRSPSK